MSTTTDICIICDNQLFNKYTGDPLVKSCTNPDCDAQAHNYCLLSNHTLDATQCKKCDNNNNVPKKFNLQKFIKISLILTYRIFCILLMPVIIIFMMLGNDVPRVTNCTANSNQTNQTNQTSCATIDINEFFMMYAVVLSLQIIMGGFGTCCRSKNDYWANALFGWSNIDYIHCYAVSIYIVCTPIAMFICQCIGYVVNIIIFRTYKFFVFGAFVSGFVSIIIICIMIPLVKYAITYFIRQCYEASFEPIPSDE